MNGSNPRRILVSSILILPVLFASVRTPARAETSIKFATLAPEGSTWMKVMTAFNQELQSKTSGQVRLKFYPGGVAGDEKDVVRKMRLGQLHSAGITGVGLGEIAPQLRVLDAPYLFRGSNEVDFILKNFNKDLSQALDAQGYVLLGWTEVGFVHIFTGIPIRSPADLKPVKMWVWEGDPIAETAFKELGIHPIPLSITDVMTSMETGLINGVYSSPMAAIALQWFTKTKFISSVPVAYAAGAVIVSKKSIASLTPEQKKILLDLGAKHMRQLTERSREENRQALETLKKEGLAWIEPASPDVLKEYDKIGATARQSLAGRLYSADLLARVEKALNGLRESHRAKKH